MFTDGQNQHGDVAEVEQGQGKTGGPQGHGGWGLLLAITSSPYPLRVKGPYS